MHWVKLKPDDVGNRVRWSDGTFGIIAACDGETFHAISTRDRKERISETTGRIIPGPSYVAVNPEGLLIADLDSTAFRLTTVWRHMMEFQLKPPGAK